MNATRSLIGLIVRLPQLWLALMAGMIALAGSNWEAMLDIARYAAERLAQ
jgi:hypothetical protein